MHWYSRDLSITSQAHPKPYITETSQQDHNLISSVYGTIQQSRPQIDIAISEGCALLDFC